MVNEYIDTTRVRAMEAEVAASVKAELEVPQKGTKTVAAPAPAPPVAKAAPPTPPKAANVPKPNGAGTPDEIHEKYKWLCRKFALGRCDDTNCQRYHHTPNPQQLAELQWAASMVGTRGGARTAVADSPRGPGARSSEEVRWCKWLSTQGHCRLGDKCIFRHADTQADMARVRAEVAKREQQRPKAAPSGGAPRTWTPVVPRRWEQSGGQGADGDPWVYWGAGGSAGSGGQ